MSCFIAMESALMSCFIAMESALMSCFIAVESALMSCFIAEFSLVPRLSRNANMYRTESLVSFLRKHDVIKIGPKQKGNVLHVIQPTMLQRSVCMLFNTR